MYQIWHFSSFQQADQQIQQNWQHDIRLCSFSLPVHIKSKVQPKQNKCTNLVAKSSTFSWMRFSTSWLMPMQCKHHRVRTVKLWHFHHRHFQAGCRKRRLNLGYNLFRFILCCSFFSVWWLVFRWFRGCIFSNVLAYVYCIVTVLSPGFNFDFVRTSQKIHWEDHLWYDLFSIEW